MDFSNAKKGDVCYTREDTPLLFVLREPDGSLLFVNPETNEWIPTDSNGVDPRTSGCIYVAPPGSVDLKSLPAGTRLRDRSGAIWQLQGQCSANDMYNYRAELKGGSGFNSHFTRGGFFQLYRAPHENDLVEVVTTELDLSKAYLGARFKDRQGCVWTLQQVTSDKIPLYRLSKNLSLPRSQPVTHTALFHKSGRLVGGLSSNDLVKEVVTTELDLSKALIGTKFKDRRGHVWTLKSVTSDEPTPLYQLSINLGAHPSSPAPDSFLFYFHKSGRLVGGLSRNHPEDLIEEVIDLSEVPNGATFMAKNGGIWVKLGMWDSTETPYLMGLLKPGTKESYSGAQCYPQDGRRCHAETLVSRIS